MKAKNRKKINAFIGSFKKGANISEEDAIRLSDFNKKILESAPISIITIDKNGVITYANKYFSNFSSAKIPLYRSIFKIPFFSREGLAPDYKKLLTDGTPLKKENCFTKNSQGQEKYINILAVPMFDEKGNIDGAISMASDVTEAVLVRKELKELNDGLGKRIFEKTKQLEKNNEQLRHILELKSQFVSDVSHELRTPLAIAKLNLELFKKQFPETDQTSIDVIGAIDGEINRVSDILSDIAFFSAIDENTSAKLNIEEINLNEFLSVLAGRVSVLAERKKIKIIFKNSKASINIKGDKLKLEKLFLNLIGNSIKYGKRLGWVKITWQPDKKNNSAKIFVSDNGVGIHKKDLPHIFDRFYRTHSSRSNGEGGFGLGLAICKWIVNQHNGSIKVKSEFGKGSEFTVVLPRS